MAPEKVLEIAAYGAWNGGEIIDNSVYEKKGMSFKGDQPVTDESIQARIGVRTRRCAAPDERIAQASMQDLMDASDLDFSRVKLVIGATNIGEDKNDPGPLVRHPYSLIKDQCPDATAIDIYAGCPGFNVAAELAFMLSLTGVLREGDISIIVGAENLHRAKCFKEDDTSQIIFGDDSLATALRTTATVEPAGGEVETLSLERNAGEDFAAGTAAAIRELCGDDIPDGLIVDNQLGINVWRTPACATRIQAAMVEQMRPAEAASGVFTDFRTALSFYEQEVNCFAFDIMSISGDPGVVQRIARSYVEAGKYKSVVSVFLTPEKDIRVTLHRGRDFTFRQPRRGLVDSLTRTMGCFSHFIQFEHYPEENDVWGNIDGKGVFLLATRGARAVLERILADNRLTMHDLDLLIEHQANFAMIPLTLAQVFSGEDDVKQVVRDYVAEKMVTNIHERGNCSVVCMQRLPYDLERGALAPDEVQGFPVNRNLDRLREAKVILRDSVGAGMTRSALLEIRD